MFFSQNPDSSAAGRGKESQMSAVIHEVKSEIFVNISLI